MANVILGLFALLCFFIGYVYLFNPTLAVKWDNSRRQMLGQGSVRQNQAWKAQAKRRGIMSIIVGILFLAIAAGVI